MSRLRYSVLTLRRADLVAAKACDQWLAQFDAICAARGDATAPSVRRKDGTSYRDPSRLRIELTPLAQVWAARDARGAVEWLRARGIWPSANLSGANLSGADLSRADLSRADLSRANLSRANLSGADLAAITHVDVAMFRRAREGAVLDADAVYTFSPMYAPRHPAACACDDCLDAELARLGTVLL